MEIDLPSVDDLKYQRNQLSEGDPSNSEIMMVKLRYKKPDGQKSQLIEQPILHMATMFENTSGNFRFSAAVAEFGMLLRQSKYTGDATYSHAAALAPGAKGEDSEGYRAEFIRFSDMVIHGIIHHPIHGSTNRHASSRHPVINPH